jgi:broad specificity phosphatase PhoE
MQVYLIRHAQCEINVLLDDAPRSKRLSSAAFNALIRGDAASPLTPEGRAQARRLAERLNGVRFDRLYTSPLPRALATAEALGEVAGLTPLVIDDLRELQPPPIRERADELTLRRLFWRAYTRMLFSPASPDAFGPAYRRARAVWSQMTREPAEAIAVVSHGMLIWFVLLSLWTDRRWRVLSRDLTNCGISLVARRR